MILLLKKLYMPSLHRHSAQLYFFRCSLSSLASKTLASSSNESPAKPHFMVEYLVSSLGFSVDGANRAAARLPRHKRPKNPDSVLNFFRSFGFQEAQIKKVIACNPRLLFSNVKRSLMPKFQGFQDLGFSGPNLTHLIMCNTYLLSYRFEATTRPRIVFWLRLLGSVEAMTKFFRKKQWLLGYSLEQRLIPNLALLREFGILDSRISYVVQTHPRFLVQRPEALKALAKKAEEMGVPRDSGMFLWALSTLRMVSKARLDTMLELMKSFGWSEADFLSAFRRNPIFLTVSEKTMRKKMDFLVNKAGCNRSALAKMPTLLMYSLEKRLIPRHHVMEVLKSEGLHSEKYSLKTIMNYSDEQFMVKFLLAHKEKVPELHDWFIDWCKGEVHSKSHVYQGDR